ncbi:serine/threonine protein kinase [Streptomyces sp. NBC_00249]|uniref:serine/threonine-protein kinase n=1 Tax=Streptomyces sp. NBC_00249 TaxID=2975690 RepID=UPI00224F4249|nr:serine/threonine-protein kinase [Streptomyces sp. NBC_00249]MCX5197009.1 serine/threonine protein kinase [Streptomyces sp. NBC_00249]
MQGLGPFRSVAVLGQGRMGRVSLAVAPDGRLVAVKQVHAGLAEDDGFRARFRREVDASRRVSGAHTAPVIDADPDAETPWLASQFVPGPSLREVLAAAGPLAEEPVRRLAAGLAHALADVHGAGLVHRDLKPSNVLLAADGVRVIDFGIARAVGDQTRITRTGALVGSPAFMSPEQITGGEPTPASDVFSLGATLVTACTGKPPFAGNSVPRLLHEVVHGEPDLSAVPPGLHGIVAPCLAKDPAARPTPRELLTMVGAVEPAVRPWPEAVHALIAAQQTETGRLVAGVPPPPPPAGAGRTRLLVTAGILAACVAVGLTVGRPVVEEVYYRIVPETVPTPGTAPLSQVADKYVPKSFACKDVVGKVTLPSDFGAPRGKGFAEGSVSGWPLWDNLCVWNSRYGDETYVLWNLYVSRPGGSTGAEQAKEHHEGRYVRGRTRRDLGLGFAEEALWLPPETDEDAPCALYLRDVNQTVFVQVKGNRYPVGSCEAAAKDAGRSALAVMARP